MLRSLWTAKTGMETQQTQLVCFSQPAGKVPDQVIAASSAQMDFCSSQVNISA